MSYFTDRMETLHITDEINTITATNIDGYPQKFQYFTEDKNGDIEIHYISPKGQVVCFGEGDEEKKAKEFCRIRYANPKDPDRKYFQRKGTPPTPFIPPIIIDNYTAKRKVPTLFITEGEFKAFALSCNDVPCIGLGGIHNFKSKTKDSLHHYISDFILDCQVENVILLFDADCLQVKWKEDKDLSTRLRSFYASVTMFREYLKPLPVTFYFAYILPEKKQKGIDDLIYSEECYLPRLKTELFALMTDNNERQYIKTHKVSGVSDYIIEQIFWLDKVENFYAAHEALLEDKDFVYKGETYHLELDEKGNRSIAVSWKGEPQQYVYIGCDLYKKVVETSPSGMKNVALTPWTQARIKMDYSKKTNLFIKQIPKFDAFTNIPENDPEKFKLTIRSEKDGLKSTLYNRYCPITHVPTPGKWETINTLIHHIFDYENIAGEPLYEFALDYLQLLYLEPNKKLPVLCLVSRENKTGKTTFLNLLQRIFLENMCIIDSDRISSQFNGSYVGKLIVAMDESLIAMDRDVVKNKIKMLTTNETVPLEEKGSNSKTVPNISKLIMCSNDEWNFMRIDEAENRYCVIKVKTIPKESNDPFMLQKMNDEIPAFLFFLKNRTLKYPEKSRLYFDEEIYETPQLQEVKSSTENQSIVAFKEVVREQFYRQKTDSVRLSIRVIMQMAKEVYTFSNKATITAYIKNVMKIPQSNPTIVRYMLDYDNWMETKDRCYQFESQQFFTPQEMETFKENGDMKDYWNNDKDRDDFPF